MEIIIRGKSFLHRLHTKIQRDVLHVYTKIPRCNVFLNLCNVLKDVDSYIYQG